MDEGEVEQHADVGVVEAVEGAAPRPADRNHPVCPQQAQRVADRGLGLSARRGQVADAQLTGQQVQRVTVGAQLLTFDPLAEGI